MTSSPTPNSNFRGKCRKCIIIWWGLCHAFMTRACFDCLKFSQQEHKKCQSDVRETQRRWLVHCKPECWWLYIYYSWSVCPFQIGYLLLLVVILIHPNYMVHVSMFWVSCRDASPSLDVIKQNGTFHVVLPLCHTNHDPVLQTSITCWAVS